MSDPLSDPRAHDLLSADPGEVWSLASLFRGVAHQAEGTAAGLRGAQHDATWTGAAADTFRSKVGQLPSELDKVSSSYQQVADALSSYEGQLAGVKADFRRLADQLGTTRSSLNGAQGQLSSAQGTLHSALQAPHATAATPAVQDAHSAVSAASGSVSRLQGDVSNLESRAYALLDHFATLRDNCAGRVLFAASVAPSESFWHHAWHDVSNWMHDAGHFMAAVGKGIWKGVTGLPGAVVDFVEHPSWKTFGKLAEDVAITASVVLLVTGVGEVLLPEEMALASTVGGVADGAEAVSSAAGSAGAAAETGQAANDAVHGRWGQAGDDLANAGIDYAAGALPSLGDALPASRAAEAAAGSSDALGAYSRSVAEGATPVQALGAMTSEDRALVLEGAGVGQGGLAAMSAAERSAFLQNLANPTSVAANAARTAERLKLAALPGKTAVDFVQEKVVVDPSVEATKAKVAQALGVETAG